MRVFYCYFWKAYHRKTKKHKWCIRYKGKIHIVNGFTVKVPTESRSRKTNPHAVLAGKATKLTLKNNYATLS